MSTAFDAKKNYSLPDAARSLGNSTRTWRNWKKAGLLPAPVAVLPNGVDIYRGADLNGCPALNGGRRSQAA
jgi:hypothetical protein